MAKIIMGIESSCDDTGVAIIRATESSNTIDYNPVDIMANMLLSQLELHKKYGGVMPEVASRAHLDIMPFLIREALSQAKLQVADLDAIAVTAGPGLIGGIVVGSTMAKSIAAASGKSIIAINHLEAHALVIRALQRCEFPFLILLVSGGHCQILIAKEIGAYEVIGRTIDDSIGECFDKVARALGLGYPGGPQIELRAKNGEKGRFSFPKPLCNNHEHCNFSLSGLKTAAIRTIQQNAPLSYDVINDFCAAFQDTIAEIITNRLDVAIKMYETSINDATLNRNIVICGGVASNEYIKNTISKHIQGKGFTLCAPPPEFSTDNAVMIAWAGWEKLRLGEVSGLDFEPRSRWDM